MALLFWKLIRLNFNMILLLEKTENFHQESFFCIFIIVEPVLLEKCIEVANNFVFKEENQEIISHLSYFILKVHKEK